MKLKAFFAGLSGRERALVYITGAIVFLVSIERFVYQPIVSRLDELEQEILAEENRLRRNVTELALGERVRKAAHASYASQAGSEDEEVARLLNEIEGLARKSGVSLVNVKPKPADTVDVGKQYPVEVELEAQMTGLMKFVHGLHSSNYLLRVKQLRLEPNKASLLIHETVIR